MTCSQSAPVALSLAMYRDPLTGPIASCNMWPLCQAQQSNAGLLHHILLVVKCQQRHGDQQWTFEESCGYTLYSASMGLTHCTACHTFVVEFGHVLGVCCSLA